MESPTTPTSRSPRARRRRLTVAGALLSAAALGTVFSVQAMAADEPSASPAPKAPSHGKPAGPAEEFKFDHGKGHGPGFAMAIRLKGGDLDEIRQAAADYKRCMRDNGLKGFPGFKVGSGDDGTVLLELSLHGRHFHPTADTHRKAHKTCAPIMKEAGVDLPDSPQPPEGPPGDGEHGLHKHLEDDGPGTQTSAHA
ncbi:hypothetical protein P8605_30895 [Streptomyces sp. T-3]|nr:hypothetical protein [Streptomyces sp. T-3]